MGENLLTFWNWHSFWYTGSGLQNPIWQHCEDICPSQIAHPPHAGGYIIGPPYPERADLLPPYLSAASYRWRGVHQPGDRGWSISREECKGKGIHWYKVRGTQKSGHHSKPVCNISIKLSSYNMLSSFNRRDFSDAVLSAVHPSERGYGCSADKTLSFALSVVRGNVLWV